MVTGHGSIANFYSLFPVSAAVFSVTFTTFLTESDDRRTHVKAEVRKHPFGIRTYPSIRKG